MGMKTPCMTYSESGQPTWGGPCAAFREMRLERDELVTDYERFRHSVEVALHPRGDGQLRPSGCDLIKEIEGVVREKAALRRALDASGIPAQARLDDKGSPLRITVEAAREIMGMVDNG